MAKAATRRKQSAKRDYREPKTAAELGLNCAVCGGLAEHFDPERARKNHLDGFVCGRESRGAKSEKLLVRN